MPIDLAALVAQLMAGGAGDKISAKEDKLQKLAESGDGQKISKMIEGNQAFQSALERGDTNAIKRQITALLATEEGARLAKQISGIIK